MNENNKKRTFSRKLKDKYRLIVFNDNTLEEVLQFRLSRLNLLSVIGSFIIILIVGVIILIAFTPLREFIPGYPDVVMRRNIVNNALRLDSLERQIQLKEKYLTNINIIISGGTPEENIDTTDKTKKNKQINFSKSESDSILRKQIEEEEKFNLSSNNKENEGSIKNVHFFTPLKGIITNNFDISRNHYGVDIVAASNEIVKACLDGVITNAIWTLETGYVIEIQHNNGLFTSYKHNSNLLKRIGDFVTAGEAIAIIGNSGELTTGPHLHFELWYNGRPLNPSDYIIF